MLSPTPCRQIMRSLLAVVVVLATVAGSAGAQEQVTLSANPYLPPEELQEITDQFTDEVFTGGQTAPRISRWVNENVFVFLQLDTGADVATATEIRYVGIGVKGVFCAETRPDPSFTHFHKYEAASYAEGHGSEPGDQGYWLTWAAATSFETRDGRQVEPGIDYEFSPLPPPDCGVDIPEVDFDPPDADALASDEIAELMELLSDGILTGGQVPPRFHRWVNEDVTIFFQFDSPSADEASALRNVGITVPGIFCAQSQPSEDFPHFHQTHAPSYGEGHGSEPGQVGYWLLWIATDTYEAFDGRQVVPGVDRQFSPTPPPECEEATSGDAPVALDVSGSEFHFSPSELHVPAAADVTLTFTNDGSVPHTLTVPALDLDTGSVAAGESATLSFTAPAEPGTHEVLCTFGGHAEEGMSGTLVVD